MKLYNLLSSTKLGVITPYNLPSNTCACLRVQVCMCMCLYTPHTNRKVCINICINVMQKWVILPSYFVIP